MSANGFVHTKEWGTQRLKEFPNNN